MRIRQHRGLLDESMETLKEIPATMEAVKQYVSDACNWLGLTKEELDSIKVDHYIDYPDKRTGWDSTYLVCMIFRDSENYAVVAMCDHAPDTEAHKQ